MHTVNGGLYIIVYTCGYKFIKTNLNLQVVKLMFSKGHATLVFIQYVPYQGSLRFRRSNNRNKTV